jgi:putative ABC transport system ATP-binding protein
MLTEQQTQTIANNNGTAPAAFELDGVSRTYAKGGHVVEALKPTTIRINRGEYVVIEGPSGSGKSTLLQLMGMLDTPTAGAIRLNGNFTNQLGADELADLRLHEIGFIFQQFNLIPTLTAAQNVAIALFPTGASKTEGAARAVELLGQVGLAERADHYPGQLSGGEQQRVAIARALANEPAILLADEPTGNLDSATGREILELIGQLNAAGQTVVLITHDREIAEAAPRRLKLRDGVIESIE